jgi:hypothetical protein
MASSTMPEGHCECCSKRNRLSRYARWLGLVVAFYEIAAGWPW